MNEDTGGTGRQLVGGSRRRMQEFLQQLVNGISAGAIYALIAVGYTLVYGVLRFINFAHGDVFMVGAVVAFYVAGVWLKVIHQASWGAFVIVLVVAMVACGVLGFLIERLAYRPLRNRPRLTALITAIGVSMLLEYGFQTQTTVGERTVTLFGASPQAFPDVLPWVNTPYEIGGVYVAPIDILVVCLTVALMLGLSLVIKYTRTGMALRAVSYRFDTAALMGINTNRIISFTFVVGSGLAAVAGVLWATKYSAVDPLMGLIPGIKAFVAAVLGGIGSVYGAAVGGLLLGLVEVMVVGYLPGGSQYRDGVAFLILIAVLLIKPSGIFAQHVGEKV
jgi:branched-chain amino acid transport system permease protein